MVHTVDICMLHSPWLSLTALNICMYSVRAILFVTQPYFIHSEFLCLPYTHSHSLLAIQFKCLRACVRVRTRARSRSFERSHIHRLNFYSFHAYLMHLNCHFQYNKSIQCRSFRQLFIWVFGRHHKATKDVCVCVCMHCRDTPRRKGDSEWWNKCPHRIRI